MMTYEMFALRIRKLYSEHSSENVSETFLERFYDDWCRKCEKFKWFFGDSLEVPAALELKPADKAQMVPNVGLLVKAIRLWYINKSTSLIESADKAREKNPNIPDARELIAPAGELPGDIRFYLQMIGDGVVRVGKQSTKLGKVILECFENNWIAPIVLDYSSTGTPDAYASYVTAEMSDISYVFTLDPEHWVMSGQYRNTQSCLSMHGCHHTAISAYMRDEFTMLALALRKGTVIGRQWIYFYEPSIIMYGQVYGYIPQPMMESAMRTLTQKHIKVFIAEKYGTKYKVYREKNWRNASNAGVDCNHMAYCVYLDGYFPLITCNESHPNYGARWEEINDIYLDFENGYRADGEEPDNIGGSEHAGYFFRNREDDYETENGDEFWCACCDGHYEMEYLWREDNDGHMYCEHCYDEGDVFDCYGCGQPHLDDSCQTFEDELYCSGCFEAMVRNGEIRWCETCGEYVNGDYAFPIIGAASKPSYLCYDCHTKELGDGDVVPCEACWRVIDTNWRDMVEVKDITNPHILKALQHFGCRADRLCSDCHANFERAGLMLDGCGGNMSPVYFHRALREVSSPLIDHRKNDLLMLCKMLYNIFEDVKVSKMVADIPYIVKDVNCRSTADIHLIHYGSSTFNDRSNLFTPLWVFYPKSWVDIDEMMFRRYVFGGGNLKEIPRDWIPAEPKLYDNEPQTITGEWRAFTPPNPADEQMSAIVQSLRDGGF